MSQTGEDRSTGRKTCSSVTLSTKKPTRNKMGSNLYLSAGVARFVFRTKEQCRTRNWTHVCYQQTEQLSVAHRLPTCYHHRLPTYHHYLIFQLQLITPLQITYGYDVTQTPCSIVTLKQATYSQSKGRC